MKRAVVLLAGCLALAQAGAAFAQTNGQAATFADGARAILSLDYDGMSDANITKGTGWPLALVDQAWVYQSKTVRGNDYLYPGEDASGKFSLSYSDISVQGAHHFALRMLSARAPTPEGSDCLLLRDARKAAAGAGWSDILNYVSMLTHGFTARKGKLWIDVRVDQGEGVTPPGAQPPNLDEVGCVESILIKDSAGNQ